MEKVSIFILLLVGMFLFFYRISMLKIPQQIFMQTKNSMEAAERQRLLANRMNLQKLQKEHSLWFRLERNLNYSGIMRLFPWLTVEKWLVCNLVVISVTFCAGAMLFGLSQTVLFVALLVGAEWLFLLRQKSLKISGFSGKL